MPPEQENIKPQINFADGTYATFKRIEEITVKENGTEIEYNQYYLKPTPRTKIKWNITEKDENFINTGNFAGFWKKKYRKDLCKPLDLSPDTAVWLLFCDYQGNEIDLFKGQMKIWLDKLKTLRKQNQGLKASKASLGYEFTKMARDPIGYMKKYGKNVKQLLDDIGSPIIANQGQSRGEESGGK